ncbi:MAG TPA: tyrosine-type recombinase/integrase [Solirubrobacteraceae bacterium]|jgi:integrase|nr:tyrosine-type recombinase/integrase [Solirubrobacteraceae bacterium]
MTIRKRGGRWAVEVYDPAVSSKKRYVGTYESQADAREAAREAEGDVARRRGRRADETVAGWADRWLDLRPRQKESTNIAYREQVAPFQKAHGDRRLRDVTVEFALEWAVGHRWTLGGVRAMFSDARRAGLVEANPFAGLRLRGSHGRKNLDVATRAEIERLAECASEVWSGEVALTTRALILMAAFVGMRPAELYGLRWSDIDFREEEVRVERQYSAATRRFELPKNGQKRTVVLTPPAKEGLLGLPRPVKLDELVFRGRKGGALTGRTQHYYWHPIRCRFGQPSMDFYELRHFCGAWLFNDLELPAQDVAHQLGHTDGGALVQRLYGHPSERLARERIKRAVRGRPREVVQLSEASRRQTS